jgi:hypothetical protein
MIEEQLLQNENCSKESEVGYTEEDFSNLNQEEQAVLKQISQEWLKTSFKCFISRRISD